MSTLPPRTEDLALRKTIFTNTSATERPAIALYLLPDGGMALELKPGNTTLLTPEQTAELYVFFDGERVRARMFDVLRRRLYRASEAGRKLVKIFDRECRRQARNAAGRAVQVERFVCDDDLDARYNTEIGTEYTCGKTFFYFPVDGSQPTLFVFGQSDWPLDLVRRDLPALIELLDDDRVRAAWAAYEASQQL